MAELFGWVGKVLFVDLTAGTSSTVPTTSYVPKFIGGRALADKLYWDTVPPGCAAFDPENRLIFATGPAAGTPGAPGASRTAIVTKSPETVPECCEHSVPGGQWSAELKFAGFDAVVVSGKAKEPCYIWIKNGEVKILKAERLWGLPVSQVDTEIRRLWGDETRSMLIGPAGENLVKCAVISTEFGHATGIGGFGAVMGSKNLKAIAVRGTGGVKVARPKDLLSFYDENVKIGGKYGGPYTVSSEAYIGYRKSETTNEDIDSWFNTEDGWWVKYWLAHEEIKAGTLKSKFEGCFACPACCQQAMQASDPTGKEKAPSDLNPTMTVASQCHEYQYQNPCEEAVFGKGGGRPQQLNYADHQEMGITMHCLGAVRNWFYEAVTLKLLTPQNTGLPVGDDKAYNTPAFLSKPNGYVYGMTYRTNDFFKRLAEGSYRFLEGMSKESAAWKTMYEKYVQRPRYTSGYGGPGGKSSSNMLDDATNRRNQSNNSMGQFTGTGKSLANFMPDAVALAATKAMRAKLAPLLGPKSFDMSGETSTFEDKVRTTVFFQNLQIEMDSIAQCGWAGFPRFYSPNTADHLGDPGVQGAKVFAAVTGIDRTMTESVAAMEAAWTLERAIHVREGRRREHDYYTDACFAATKWTTKAEFGKALDDYYTARGWDKATGIPTRTQLVKLGMTDVADDLEKKYGVKVPA